MYYNFQVSEVNTGQGLEDMVIDQPFETKAKESFKPDLPTAQTLEPVQVLGMWLNAEGIFKIFFINFYWPNLKISVAITTYTLKCI